MNREEQTSSDKKFIFVTGGVVSSLGKGLLAASLGSLLESRKYKISLIKCDPYINVDPGTMSPFQHGEVYVTSDGAETDMDLGHYERFTQALLKKENSITAGQVYENVILKERQGVYLGNTVQVIPHITDEIKSCLYKATGDAEIVIVEIGGTIGDIESLPFIEAIRQMRVDLGFENTAFVHLTLVPYVPSAGELKSKPSQHSVKALREVGIQPDFLICRSDRPLPVELKKKLALFCSIRDSNVIATPDVKNIYEVPLVLQTEEFDSKVLRRLSLASRDSGMEKWKRILSVIKTPDHVVSIALVGKYVDLKDSYQSIHEALVHGGLANRTFVEVKYIDSESLTDENMAQKLGNVSGVLIPGGFGERGVEGKVKAVRYVREQQIPFLGICFGMQMALLEFAQNVCGLKNVVSTEFTKTPSRSQEPVVDYVKGQLERGNKKGASMRLGSYTCQLKENSLIRRIYGSEHVQERHRHRYQFNDKFKKLFENSGMLVSGVDASTGLTEVIEITEHPFFVGVQFHPEFQSKPVKPHPLFSHFVLACLPKKLSNRSKWDSSASSSP